MGDRGGESGKGLRKLGLSVIVPAYNEEKNIEQCLKALKREGVEIIVVYGGDDRTPEIAKKYADVVVREEGTGVSSARNQGARLAKNEIVAFVDADSIVADGWARALLSCFEPGVVAVGGVLSARSEKAYERLIVWLSSNVLPRIFAKLGFFMFSGTNCAFRKEAFLKAGGFREDLRILEDTEIGNRMKKYGRVRMCKKAKVLASVRRFRRYGWISTTIKYWLAYLDIFLLKRKPRVSYERLEK